jgi:hypothetical protein
MSTASFLVVNHAIQTMQDVPLNLSFVVLVGDVQNTYRATRISASKYSVQFPAKQLGTQIMAVYNDRYQLSNSPFRFNVILPSCSNFPGMVPDISGQCICPFHAQANIRGSCIAYEVILPAAIIPVFVCIAAVAFFFFFRQAAREDQLWRIKEKDIYWPDPPEVLGTGSSGSVYRADFRGTPVAIKRFRTLKEVQQLHQHKKSEYAESNLILVNRDPEDLSTPRISTSIPPVLESKSSILSKGAIKEDVRKKIKFLVNIRHPYITTVLGGVLVNGKELCLVMELMELGSLFDCLHNLLFPMEGELALNFLHNISKGMAFLHTADPPIRHGDLKSGMMDSDGLKLLQVDLPLSFVLFGTSKYPR